LMKKAAANAQASVLAAVQKKNMGPSEVESLMKKAAANAEASVLSQLEKKNTGEGVLEEMQRKAAANADASVLSQLEKNNVGPGVLEEMLKAAAANADSSVLAELEKKNVGPSNVAQMQAAGRAEVNPLTALMQKNAGPSEVAQMMAMNQFGTAAEPSDVAIAPRRKSLAAPRSMQKRQSITKKSFANAEDEEMYHKKYEQKIEHESELLERFKQIDSDGDGLLTFDELFDYLTKEGKDVTKEQVMDLLLEVDMNEDGFVDADEFAAVFDRAPEKMRSPARAVYDALNSVSSTVSTTVKNQVKRRGGVVVAAAAGAAAAATLSVMKGHN